MAVHVREIEKKVEISEILYLKKKRGFFSVNENFLKRNGRKNKSEFHICLVRQTDVCLVLQFCGESTQNHILNVAYVCHKFRSQAQFPLIFGNLTNDLQFFSDTTIF